MTNYNPDVLECLANLSSDEVFTPPKVVNEMLNMLPQELFRDPNTTFLDPATKSGVFLREITKRLIDGLADVIPDLQERVDHILHKQVFGIAMTELTSLMSRRSVYCSKWPNGAYSISHFDNAEGNILFRAIRHTWRDGKCVYCGASQSEYDRAEGMETHAYEFIHVDDPRKIFGDDMKFDVVIGNPPYHLSDGGSGSSSKPIYQHFVDQAKKIDPKYIAMIIPSRWFTGGKGLDNFRSSMLNDDRLTKLVDYQNAKDCFPGVSLGGGVCYFLWERERSDLCEITNVINAQTTTQKRALNEYPIFIRYNEAIDIINKISAKAETSAVDHIGTRNPFGLPTNARGIQSRRKGYYPLYSSKGVSYIPPDAVGQGHKLINTYKIMISRFTCEHAGEPDKAGQYRVISTTKILEPTEVCTDSYIIAFANDNRRYVENALGYLKTKFVRFLLLQALSSINLTRDSYQFVPMQDFSKEWTDEELYAKYDLSEEETAFIETIIRPMDTSGGDENA